MGSAFRSFLLVVVERLTEKGYALLIGIIVALVLYGAVKGESLFGLVVSFVGARCAYLIAQIANKQQNAGEWQDPGETKPRSQLEEMIECAGLLGFCLLFPLVWMLYTREIVSLRTNQSWATVIVVLLGLIFYLLPFAVSTPGVRLRSVWWGLPLLPAAVLLIAGIHVRHPYLNPFNPDRERLAAERVLALEDGILAGHHYDWLTAHARTLHEHGNPEEAIRFYQAALRLNPYQEDVRQRLAELSPEIERNEHLSDATSALKSHDPYWAQGYVVAPLPRCELDKRMEGIARTTIVILRAGEQVSESLVDAVGDVIARELDIPVCTVPHPIALPSHTRVRGIVDGRQWAVSSLSQAVENYIDLSLRAPLKYVVLTSVDIYNGEANFVFAASWLNGGALVSTARFGDPVKEQHLVAYRTAKQSLSSILKSFGVPESVDVNSVLSYAQSVEEHDRKGNRPSAEAMAIFRENLRSLDAAWKAYKG
jgi:predicted Zn-dependent protease